MIQVEYSLSPDDERDKFQSLRITLQPSTILVLAGWFVAFLAALFLFLFASPWWFFLWLVPALYGFGFARSLLAIRHPPRAQLQRQLPRDRDVKLQIDREAITEVSPHSTTVTRWTAFDSKYSYEGRTHFFLVGGGVVLTLPKRVFSEPQLSDIRDLMARTSIKDTTR